MSIVLEAIEAAPIVAVICGGWVLLARDSAVRATGERRALFRSRRAEDTAAQAAVDEPAFDPVVVKTAVIEILAAVERISVGEATAVVTERPDGEVIVDWAGRKGLGGGIRFDEAPRIDLLRVVNRESDEEDRVYVRVRAEAEVTHRRGRLDPHTYHLDERWALGRHGGSWQLLDGFGDPLAERLLEAPLIASRSEDEERLRHHGMGEIAARERVGDDHIAWHELVGQDQDAAGQLRDLALIDGRFSEAVIESTIDEVLDLWEQMSIGGGHGLAALTSERVAEQLLRPEGGGVARQLVLRDVTRTGWRPRAAVLDRSLPQVVVDLSITASWSVRDPRDRHVVLLGGSRARPFALTWTLELAPGDMPWRLVEVSNPTADLPGLG